jgi:hypothetical protein
MKRHGSMTSIQGIELLLTIEISLLRVLSNGQAENTNSARYTMLVEGL